MLIFFQPPPHLPKARGARSFRCSLRLIFTGVVWNQAAIVMGFPAGGGIFAITPVSLCMAVCTPDLFKEKQKPIHLGMTKNGDNGVTLSCLLIMFPGPMRQTLDTEKIHPFSQRRWSFLGAGQEGRLQPRFAKIKDLFLACHVALDPKQFESSVSISWRLFGCEALCENNVAKTMTRTTSNNTSVINYWEKSVFLPIPRITVLTWRLHGKAQPPLIQETLKPLLPCVVSGAAAPSDLCSKVTRSMGYTSPVPGQASSRTAATATVWPANCQLLGPRANHVCMYIYIYIFIIVSTYNYDLLYLYIYRYRSIIYRVIYIHIYTWYVTYTLYIHTYIHTYIYIYYFKIF